MGRTDWLVVALCLLQLVNLGLSCFFGGRLRRLRGVAASLRRAAKRHEDEHWKLSRGACDERLPVHDRNMLALHAALEKGQAAAYNDAASDIDTFISNGDIGLYKGPNYATGSPIPVQERKVGS